jgi:Rrf2 family transcriptional regulator, nitric oxide-sensitive transcriptional repressor
LGYIADRSPELVQIKDISMDQGISESHLRLVIADLANAGIVLTKQGRYGGVELAKPPEKITVFDILLAV